MLLLSIGARITAAVLNVPLDPLSFLPMVAPPPSSPADAARRAASSRALAGGWDERDGFDAPSEMVDWASLATPASESAEVFGGEEVGEEDLDLDALLSRPSTYGEITELGARQLYRYMGMSGPYWPSRRRRGEGEVSPDDGRRRNDGGAVSFFDLGSGAGRLVAQSYMEVPRLRRSVGVELAPSRHAAAVRAWGGLSRGGTANDVRNAGGDDASVCPDAAVELIEGDLFAADISDATHVYVASLCFTEDMMRRLAGKLVEEATRLQCVGTLKPFPGGGKGGLGMPRLEYVEMSWSKSRGEGCSVYFYDTKA